MIEALQSAAGLDAMVGGVALAIVIATMMVTSRTIMRESGFGTMINGLLVIAGAAAGVALRAVTFGFQ